MAGLREEEDISTNKNLPKQAVRMGIEAGLAQLPKTLRAEDIANFKKTSTITTPYGPDTARPIVVNSEGVAYDVNDKKQFKALKQNHVRSGFFKDVKDLPKNLDKIKAANERVGTKMGKEGAIKASRYLGAAGRLAGGAGLAVDNYKLWSDNISAFNDINNHRPNEWAASIRKNVYAPAMRGWNSLAHTVGLRNDEEYQQGMLDADAEVAQANADLAYLREEAERDAAREEDFRYAEEQERRFQQKQQQKKQQQQQIPVGPQVRQISKKEAKYLTRNSNDPGKWRPGPDGSGLIKRSDGSFVRVRPSTDEEKAAQDRNYENHIKDQVDQYMLNALSLSQSPFVSPQRAAMYADQALGLRSVMGGGGGINNLQAMKLAAAQDATNRQIMENSLKRQDANLELQHKDDPQGLAAAKMKKGMEAEQFRDVDITNPVALRNYEAAMMMQDGMQKAIDDSLGHNRKSINDLTLGNSNWQHGVNMFTNWFRDTPWYPPQPVINDGRFLLGDTPVVGPNDVVNEGLYYKSLINDKKKGKN